MTPTEQQKEWPVVGEEYRRLGPSTVKASSLVTAVEGELVTFAYRYDGNYGYGEDSKPSGLLPVNAFRDRHLPNAISSYARLEQQNAQMRVALDKLLAVADCCGLRMDCDACRDARAILASVEVGNG